MHVESVAESEVRVTLETTFTLVNDLRVGELDARATLTAAGFSRAAGAPKASLDRLTQRLADLVPLLDDLHHLETEEASARINEEITELPIAPSVIDHGGIGPHIHWTPPTARFDDQVISDIVMAIAQELCDNGTDRFGRCVASDCDDLFYDNTRNRSRRFCDDPRCASRTHTADHRARKSNKGLSR